MLSAKTIQIIKSTVPVLETHGTAITKRFYQLLFSNHPELLNLFNHANQKQGRQPAALANAIYAAAANIDRLEAIAPAVRQIAHKHRSLGVTAEQYPIVGRNLLAAIKEVLGDAATDDILEAWGEAYGAIAKVFIEVEAGMYKESEEREGGWSGFRPFRVERKVRESSVIASFYLVPADGGAAASFEPGQYVSVKCSLPGETYTHIRQYSLSDAPGKPYYRITVKREDGTDSRDGGKVSRYLHEHVREGDVLQLSAPAGDFTADLQDARPAVLISGGVGLTPLISMLHSIAGRQPNRRVIFIHAARNGDVHALKEETEAAVGAHPQAEAHWCYSEPSETDRRRGSFHKEGFIDADWLRHILPDEPAAYYFCGPAPFMRSVYRALKSLHVPAADMHYEFFGPAASLEESVSALS